MTAFILTSTPISARPLQQSPSRFTCPSTGKYPLTKKDTHPTRSYAIPTAVIAPRPVTAVPSTVPVDESSPVSSIKTMEQFWKLADESKVNAQYEADGCIAFLKEASLEEIRNVCLQYRYFVERYPDNLSRLLAKMPNQQLKSLLSSILSEELGSGEISGAHIVWYDRFLRSIGVAEHDLASGIYDENEDILSEIEYRCTAKSFEHVVGMVGMGGECLCQIYLTVMYRYLRQNPVMKAMSGQVDWEFWTYHVGEEDIEHRRLVRECIDEMVMGEDGVRELAMGYSFGKGTWDKFWRNNFKNTRAGRAFFSDM